MVRVGMDRLVLSFTKMRIIVEPPPLLVGQANY